MPFGVLSLHTLTGTYTRSECMRGEEPHRPHLIRLAGSIFGIYDPNDECKIEDMDDPEQMMKNCVLNVCQPGEVMPPARPSPHNPRPSATGQACTVKYRRQVRFAAWASRYVRQNPAGTSSNTSSLSWSPVRMLETRPAWILNLCCCRVVRRH